MAKGTVNKVIIIGRLGADPEVRYTTSGVAIANVRVATDESWKDRNTGETQEHTEWHRITCFGKLGEIVGQYLRKGSKAYFEGRLQTKKWQDQSGQDRYSTDIVANEMQMLDSRGTGGSSDFTPGTVQPARPASAPNRDVSHSREQYADDFESGYSAAPRPSYPSADTDRGYEQPVPAVVPAAIDPSKRQEPPPSQDADKGFNDIIPF